MNWQVFWITLGTVFLAEMGDKTQLAALSMTADTRAPVAVFLGASLALCLATLLGVVFGGVLSHYVPQHIIKKAAGIAFIAIGGLILLGKW
ncbi:MAG: TMEM165/GDT1 family protein [Deltaproteobacteria bacterium]|nr:TMEM165/GDT1 family protein [Deltaproteobacteria bacterium]